MKKILYRLTKKPFYIKKLYFYYFHKLWRKNNMHNRLSISQQSHVFPSNKYEELLKVISVGKASYGEIIVYYYGEENSFLNIGNFVSIGKNVFFILGGNHYSSGLFNYPFRFLLKAEGLDSYSKGPITLEDDVWIGMNTIILSGVIIGKGAVVAAGSVVTRDVDPFTIVAGNPAQKVKSRLTPEIVDLLMKIDYTQIDPAFIKKNIESIYKGDKTIIDDMKKFIPENGVE